MVYIQGWIPFVVFVAGVVLSLATIYLLKRIGRARSTVNLANDISKSLVNSEANITTEEMWQKLMPGMEMTVPIQPISVLQKYTYLASRDRTVGQA